MERFCEEIRDHVLCGTVADFDPYLFDLISDIKMFNIEVVLSALAGKVLVIYFQSLCRLVFFMEVHHALYMCILGRR